ncbi:patatin-like phospholipase family protein [Actinomadura rupiterrae]|uniref:patatin-like phospholipase family protein n=1 Tax=Actinomadura rupiterrae TaxID=559627 RepID=UPI0020A5E8D7|nr:patatin-like phospholipase family protein [Actinomadura rupiterrae]MCP2339082.1 NTE family protein [Actinomadura rupiterrae]
MAGRTALVLGGGGVAGIAWEAGVLAGLAEGGADVLGADLLVGTSAGSAVAAQVGTGLSAGELYERQVDPALQNYEFVPEGVSLEHVWEEMTRIQAEYSDVGEVRRQIGAAALATETVSEKERYAVVEGRLPVHEWPERPLQITAVNATTGAPVVWTKDSGVPLVDAVAASCAVPGIWPPVTVGDVRYIDGGIRSIVNADLAAGFDIVLVVAPLADPALDGQVAALRDAGAVVDVIAADDASLAAFGTDPLSPGTRTPSAKAGRDQGLAAASTIAEHWAGV